MPCSRRAVRSAMVNLSSFDYFRKVRAPLGLACIGPTPRVLGLRLPDREREASGCQRQSRATCSHRLQKRSRPPPHAHLPAPRRRSRAGAEGVHGGHRLRADPFSDRGGRHGRAVRARVQGLHEGHLRDRPGHGPRRRGRQRHVHRVQGLDARPGLPVRVHRGRRRHGHRASGHPQGHELQAPGRGRVRALTVAPEKRPLSLPSFCAHCLLRLFCAATSSATTSGARRSSSTKRSRRPSRTTRATTLTTRARPCRRSAP